MNRFGFHTLSFIAAILLLAGGLGVAELLRPPSSPHRLPSVAAENDLYRLRGFHMGSSLPVENGLPAGNPKHVLKHSDLVTLRTGLPWQESLAGKAQGSSIFKSLLSSARQVDRQNKAVMIVVDPLTLDRDAIAGFPPERGAAEFRNPEVREALRLFTVAVAGEIRPDYLVIGSEVNLYQTARARDFPEFVTLYRELYAELRRTAPEMKIFPAFQRERLERRSRTTIQELDPYMDALGISTYPELSGPATVIPDDYFATLREQTAKPIVIVESGCATPADKPDAQAFCLERIGRLAIAADLEAWIWTFMTDFDPTEPSGKGLEDSFYSSMGLYTASGEPKPSLKRWRTIQRGE